MVFSLLNRRHLAIQHPPGSLLIFSEGPSVFSGTWKTVNQVVLSSSPAVDDKYLIMLNHSKSILMGKRAPIK